MLDPKDIEPLRKEFQYHDKDKTGFLNAAELRLAMQHVPGADFSENDI